MPLEVIGPHRSQYARRILQRFNHLANASRILLPDGSLKVIEVARCFSIQDRCFEIGTRFVDDVEAPTTA